MEVTFHLSDPSLERQIFTMVLRGVNKGIMCVQNGVFLDYARKWPSLAAAGIPEVLLALACSLKFWSFLEQWAREFFFNERWTNIPSCEQGLKSVERSRAKRKIHDKHQKNRNFLKISAPPLRSKFFRGNSSTTPLRKKFGGF